MTDQKKISVLFLCTGNSCRSQMAEAILHHLGGDRFESLSAGSRPAGFVHPLAIDAMEQLDIALNSTTSKSWDEFAARPVDVVITVCDAAAAEVCPVWPGAPVKAHWSLADPAYHPGTDEERLSFALLVAERLKTKIQAMIELDWSSGRVALADRLAFLGQI